MTKQTRREFLRTAGSVAASAGMLSVLPRDSASADEAERAKRPNILFFFPDQHRYDWLGTTPGLNVRTPNLDKLAADGVRFTRAFCASPLCAPSRACLAAGKEYDRCRVLSNRIDYPIEQTTFYSFLRESGYHVMGCGKFDLHKGSRIWGIDGKHLLKEWGFSDGIDNGGKWDAAGAASQGIDEPYTAYLRKRGLLDAHLADFQQRRKVGRGAVFATPLPDDAYCDNYAANNGLQLIKNSPQDKPWFLQINFPGPHAPWDITESMEPLYEGVDFPVPNGGKELSPEEYVAVRRNYSAMVTNIDRWLGVYLEELEKRGELDNTLIVYSSDHGEMLGDHNTWGKSRPYEPSVGVPLTVWGPSVEKGVVSDALVSVMDLAATFLEYASLQRPSDMDSLSLKPLLEGKTQIHRACVLSGLQPWRMVFDGRYKLIKGFESDSPVLFDLQEDPLENNNIAAKAGDEVARLSLTLEEGVVV